MEEENLYKIVYTLTAKKDTPIMVNVYKFKVLSKKNTYWEVIFNEEFGTFKKRVKIEDFNILTIGCKDSTSYMYRAWTTDCKDETVEKYLKQYKEIVNNSLNKEKSKLMIMEENLQKDVQYKVIDNEF